MHILLVDDDPFVTKLIMVQLAQLGHTAVTACGSGGQALAVLETGEPTDLILCDLQMPEMDGVELVRHLVRLSYAGALVLISGEDERILQAARQLATAHRLNVLGSLQKPIFAEQLEAVLARLPMPTATPQPAPTSGYAADELQQAITDGQLINYYQPKVELRTGEPIGVETLVRWQHPRDGLVPPDRFIALAENSGLINQLTRVVLTEALRQTREWQAQRLSLQIAVNVSMANLTDVSFADAVTDAAQAAGVPLNRLVLEVTESRLMVDRVPALDILTRLRLKQVSLAIDDFGTGHSSLAQLRDIPFIELKLDRGFVHGAARDASLRAILENSLSLARQLRMTTVAEGVEDREDWDFLRHSGCDSAQGYFIGRPMPAEQTMAWTEEWNGRRGQLMAPGA